MATPPRPPDPKPAPQPPRPAAQHQPGEQRHTDQQQQYRADQQHSGEQKPRRDSDRQKPDTSRLVADDQPDTDPQEVIEQDDLLDDRLHRVSAVAGVSRMALEDGEEWPGRPHTLPEGHNRGEPGPGEPGGPTAGHYAMPGEEGGPEPGDEEHRQQAKRDYKPER